MAAEREVVEAALSAIASVGGPQYVIEGPPPDEIERSLPDVDHIATADGARLAIEHTQIEPYELYLADQNLAHERLGPVRDLVTAALPDGFVFDLSIQPGAAKAIKARHVGPLADWIRRVVPDLRDPPNHWIETPAGVIDPPIRLYRWHIEEGMRSEPRMRYRIGYDEAAMKEDAIRRCARAMSKKLPKLEAARARHGAGHTMLVLENADWEMTEPWSLGARIEHAVRDAELPAPDFLVMVSLAPGGTIGYAQLYRFDGDWLPRPKMITIA